MRVDKKATTQARSRQAKGVERLRKAFAWSPAVYDTVQHGDLRPYRRKPGVPPMRPDLELRRKRRRRKIAHESRRRNR